jgi:hypothetical protein
VPQRCIHSRDFFFLFPKSPNESHLQPLPILRASRFRHEAGPGCEAAQRYLCILVVAPIGNRWHAPAQTGAGRACEDRAWGLFSHYQPPDARPCEYVVLAEPIHRRTFSHQCIIFFLRLLPFQLNYQSHLTLFLPFSHFSRVLEFLEACLV